MLRKMFQRIPRASALPSDGTHYEFKPNLVGNARLFDLTDEGLSWQSSAKTGVWPLGKIAAIRLSYRPISMQSRRFRADIEDSRGERVTIYSTTWQTVALMSPQDDGYRAFIVELHRRLKAAKSDVFLIAGINRFVYSAGLVLMSLVGASMIVLLLRALWIREFTGALFMIAFTALFAWQIGGFMKRNRPRNYTLEALADGCTSINDVGEKRSVRPGIVGRPGQTSAAS